MKEPFAAQSPGGGVGGWRGYLDAAGIREACLAGRVPSADSSSQHAKGDDETEAGRDDSGVCFSFIFLAHFPRIYLRLKS